MNGIKKPKVAFLGPKGTFSHQVTFNYFGEGFEYVPKPTITMAFAALSDDIPFLCMPIANSTHGSVIESLDCFRSDRWGRDAFIRDETSLKIEHCLVVGPSLDTDNRDTGEEDQEALLKSIDVVYSHEQALGQCTLWLTQHMPQAKRVKSDSTATAARTLLRERPKEPRMTREAAICAEVCVITYAGLRLIQRGIQDRSDNETRFVVVSHSQATPLSVGQPKARPTTALFRLGLFSSSIGFVLGHLSRTVTYETALLQRIDRRPALGTERWKDVYFLEFKNTSTNGVDMVEVARDIQKTIGECGEVTLLGVW
ncbi:PDT-domain-containing protein [Serendipita vermifera]|nr:PDT-domain-containing protein [Serendipita vermifera]